MLYTIIFSLSLTALIIDLSSSVKSSLPSITTRAISLDLSNFSDLSIPSFSMSLSAKTGDGVEELKAELYKRVFGGGVDLNSQYVAEERHYYALKKAKDALLEGLSNVDIVPLDLVAEDIKSVWLSLGEITGKTASEEIIDEIFKKFCVGK